MKNTNDLFGKKVELNSLEALQRLEAGISEGLLSSVPLPNLPVANLFGRALQSLRSRDLAYLAGWSSAGLRGAVLFSKEDAAGNSLQIADLVRRHLPAVLHLVSNGQRGSAGENFSVVPFQLASATSQQAVDFAIIAHRIAELSLLPGLHMVEDNGEDQPVLFPPQAALRSFLGRADDQIQSPTPAQQILFGRQRRRLPNWFNFDHLLLHGVRKDEQAYGWETAARKEYFLRHLPEIIQQVLTEYASLTGRHYQPLQTHGPDQADYLVLSTGPAFASLTPAVDLLRTEEKVRVAGARFNLVRPFPKEKLAALLKGKKGVTILEPLENRANTDSFLYTQVASLLGEPGRRTPELFYGYYHGRGSIEAMVEVFRNMMKGGEKKKFFFLDIPFTAASSAVPTHEVLLQSIRREYPDLEGLTLRGPSSSNGGGKNAGKREITPDLPLAIRQYQDHGPPYSRLSRFYSDTAYFYQTGEKHELVADPFQALPQLPPATANFSGGLAQREKLPVFEPEKCTGCGACFVHCPHAAIPPLALDPASLVRGAMSIAHQRGTPVSKLTPLLRQISAIAGKVIGQKASTIRRAGDFLPAVFEKLLLQTKADDEKKKLLEEESAIVLGIIRDFPVAITPTFFTGPEKHQAGSGELFSLAIDPTACTACGLCAALCPESALEMAPQTPEKQMQTQAAFRLWEQLPDTNGATISRLQKDAAYDPLAATLLSRNFYLSMSGGAASEAGAPTKAMLHLVTAVLESVVQPRMVKQLNEMAKVADDLSKNIHKLLTKAIPSSDFAVISEALRKSGSPRMPLDELMENLAEGKHLDLLDTGELERKIELYNQLKSLEKVLGEGSSGTGRARYGLVLVQEGLPWQESYPLNSFTVPTLLWPGEGASESVLGLVRGHVRHLLDNLRLLRRAQLEIKNKYEPAQHDEMIAALCWEDLEQSERELIPPLLLVGTAAQLAGKGAQGLVDLLGAGGPVKVILLDPGGEESNQNPVLAMCLSRQAYVLQSSLADHRHLLEGLVKGMMDAKPAVFHLLTLTQAEKNDWPALAPLAIQTRTFPHFEFDPQAAVEFFAPAMDLGSNPSLEANWFLTGLTHRREGEEETLEYSLTPADWLFTHARWQPEFTLFPSETDEAVPVAAYLLLDERARTGKIPVILTLNQNEELTRWRVSARVIEFVREKLSNWNNLRELAGLRAPFSLKKLEEEVQTLQASHDQEVAQLRREYEGRLATLETALMQQVKIKLRDRLLALSQRQD